MIDWNLSVTFHQIRFTLFVPRLWLSTLSFPCSGVVRSFKAIILNLALSISLLVSIFVLALWKRSQSHNAILPSSKMHLKLNQSGFHPVSFVSTILLLSATRSYNHFRKRQLMLWRIQSRPIMCTNLEFIAAVLEMFVKFRIKQVGVCLTHRGFVSDKFCIV